MSSLRLIKNWVFLNTKVDGKQKDIPLHVRLDHPEYKTTKSGKRRVVFPKALQDVKTRMDLEAALSPFGIRTQPKAVVQAAPKLSVVMADYFRFRGASVLGPKTQEHYRRACESFMKYYGKHSGAVDPETKGDLPVDQYTDPLVISDWREMLLRTSAQATAASTVRRVTTVFKYAVKRNHTRINPMLDFKLKELPGENIHLDEAELLAFKDATRHTEAHDDLFNQCMFLLLSALRSEESCVLLWSQFDFTRGTLRYWNMKGKRWETVEMDPYLLWFMSTQVPHKFGEKVFKYKNHWALRRKFIRLRDRMGWRSELTIHSFKKTAGQILYKHGVATTTMARLMHHTDFETTYRYYVETDRDLMRETAASTRDTVNRILPMPSAPSEVPAATVHEAQAPVISIMTTRSIPEQQMEIEAQKALEKIEHQKQLEREKRARNHEKILAQKKAYRERNKQELNKARRDARREAKREVA